MLKRDAVSVGQIEAVAIDMEAWRRWGTVFLVCQVLVHVDAQGRFTCLRFVTLDERVKPKVSLGGGKRFNVRDAVAGNA